MSTPPTATSPPRIGPEVTIAAPASLFVEPALVAAAELISDELLPRVVLLPDVPVVDAEMEPEPELLRLIAAAEAREL